MNISFLRNAQAEEKEEMSYFCMHAPAAAGPAAGRDGAGSRQVQPPVHPASRSVPAGSTGHGHPRPRMRPHQPRTLSCQAKISHSVPKRSHGAARFPPPTPRPRHPACPGVGPASLPSIPQQHEDGSGGAGSHQILMGPRLPVPQAGQDQAGEGSGAVRLHGRFSLCKFRPCRKPALGKN